MLNFIASLKLGPVIGTAFGIQTACLLIAVPLQTERFYDLSGSLTYLACIGVSLLAGRRNIYTTGGIREVFKSLHPRQVIVSTFASIWAFRLGSHLFYRIMRDKKDDRFNRIKLNPIRFSIAWIMQACWVTLTALPVYALNAMQYSRMAKLGVLDAVGILLWVFGFLFETTADIQKLRWQERIGAEARKTAFINEGLWSLSRHPNYFGEITLWIGNWMICSSAYRLAGTLGLTTSLVFTVSPAFIIFLLTRVSGIPLLERNSDKRFANNNEYQKYKSETPILIPKLPKFKNKND